MRQDGIARIVLLAIAAAVVLAGLVLAVVALRTDPFVGYWRNDFIAAGIHKEDDRYNIEMGLPLYGGEGFSAVREGDALLVKDPESPGGVMIRYTIDDGVLVVESTADGGQIRLDRWDVSDEEATASDDVAQ
jgi:hypothetical protein